MDAEQPDLEPALNCSLVAAVLHRDLPNVWNNVLVFARRSGAAGDFVRDCLRVGYRHSGTALADALIESQSRSEDADEDLLALLNDVMTEVDRAERPSAFILRLPAEDGQMNEIEFVTGVPDRGVAALTTRTHRVARKDETTRCGRRRPTRARQLMTTKRRKSKPAVGNSTPRPLVPCA